MTTVRGYAAVWSCEAEIDGHRERFERGAFRYARSTSLRFGHDLRPGAVLAWHCPVAEDRTGLRFAATLDDRKPEHRRLIAAIRAGMSGVSLGFRTLQTSWSEPDLETVELARLREISITGSAAYPDTGCWISGDDLARAPGRIQALADAFAEPVAPQSGHPVRVQAAPSRSGQRLPIDPVRAAAQRYMALMPS